jgi:acyl-CoA thioesterase
MVRRVPLSCLAPEEVRAWVQHTRAALLRKMQRERAYLERRARRGVWTPTDEAYEADQELEADLLALLDEIEQGLEGVI